MSYLLWYDAASFSSLLLLLLFIPCSAVYLCYCQCRCVSEAEMYLSRICLCKSYFFRGTCVLTQMAGVMLRTPRWYSEICESVFRLSVTVQSKILFIYPEVTVKEVLKKSSWAGDTFPLLPLDGSCFLVSLCLIWKHSKKVYLMGQGKIPG